MRETNKQTDAVATNKLLPDDAKLGHQFARLMQLAVSVSLGFMAAFLWSLKQINPQVRFEVSFDTFAAFLVAGGVSWFIWPTAARARRRFLTFAAAVLLLTAGAFAYGVKDVSGAKLRDVAIGATLAVVALSVLGFALWLVSRFLEQDARTADQDRSEPDKVR